MNPLLSDWPLQEPSWQHPQASYLGQPSPWSSWLPLHQCVQKGQTPSGQQVVKVLDFHTSYLHHVHRILISCMSGSDPVLGELRFDFCLIISCWSNSFSSKDVQVYPCLTEVTQCNDEAYRTLPSDPLAPYPSRSPAVLLPIPLCLIFIGICVLVTKTQNLV